MVPLCGCVLNPLGTVVQAERGTGWQWWIFFLPHCFSPSSFRILLFSWKKPISLVKMQLSSRLSDATVITLSSVLPVDFEMQVISECTVFMCFRRVFSRFRKIEKSDCQLRHVSLLYKEPTRCNFGSKDVQAILHTFQFYNQTKCPIEENT